MPQPFLSSTIKSNIQIIATTNKLINLSSPPFYRIHRFQSFLKMPIIPRTMPLMSLYAPVAKPSVIMSTIIEIEKNTQNTDRNAEIIKNSSFHSSHSAYLQYSGHYKNGFSCGNLKKKIGLDLALSFAKDFVKYNLWLVHTLGRSPLTQVSLLSCPRQMLIR